MIRRLWATEREQCLLMLAYWSAWFVFGTARWSPPDSIGYYAYAQSLLIDGDLSIANELAAWHVAPMFLSLTDVGQVNNVFACGAAMLWLPFVGAVHAVLLIAAACGIAAPHADGSAYPYLASVAFASAWYGYLALALSYKIASCYIEKSSALLATLALGSLSSFWHYAFFEGALAHAPSAFADALFVYLCVTMFRADASATRRVRADWLQLGFAAGLVTIVRWQEVIMPVTVAVVLARDMVHSVAARVWTQAHFRPWLEREPWSAAACYAVGALAVFAPQMLIWQVEHGVPLAVPHGAGFFHWTTPALSYVLFSSHHGLFSWTPLVAVAACVGVPLAWRTDRRLSVLAFICITAQVYINASVTDPAGGNSFGARRFTGSTVFFVFGLAVLLEYLPRIARAMLLLFAGAWTAPLWLAFEQRIIDPGLFVTYGDITKAMAAAVMSLPRFCLQTGASMLSAFAQPLWQIVTMAGLSALALVVAWACSLALHSRRAPRKANRFWSVCVLTVNAVVLFGAARTSAVGVTATRFGDLALLDFGWYANSKYDVNPFDPTLNVGFPFRLPRAVNWGAIPFDFTPPAQPRVTDASNLTTCNLPFEQFTLALPPTPTRALHFAISAAGALSRGAPVLTVRALGLAQGSSERTLRAGIDVWDVFQAVPADRLLYHGTYPVAGYTWRFAESETPTTLVFSSPFSSDRIWPCMALFAITRELPASADGRAQFQAIDLSSLANAKREESAFRPGFLLNFYPDLRPGLLQLGPRAFRILDRKRTAVAENAWTNAGVSEFHGRVPLLRESSTELALLVRAVTGSADMQPRHLADLEVEYERGPNTTYEVWSPRDVGDYLAADQGLSGWRGTGYQRLDQLVIRVDRERVPRNLWMSRPRDVPLPKHAGLAIFAITQSTRASLQPHAGDD